MKNRPCKFNQSVVLPTPIWGSEATQLFTKVVDEVRKEFIKDYQDLSNFEGEVYVGTRTMNNETVFECLRSNVNEAAFMLEPLTLVYEALHKCADRDWWYRFEKKWD